MNKKSRINIATQTRYSWHSLYEMHYQQ